jgi:hypothetical protein
VKRRYLQLFCNTWRGHIYRGDDAASRQAHHDAQCSANPLLLRFVGQRDPESISDERYADWKYFNALGAATVRPRVPSADRRASRDSTRAWRTSTFGGWAGDDEYLKHLEEERAAAPKATPGSDAESESEDEHDDAPEDGRLHAFHVPVPPPPPPPAPHAPPPTSAA